MEGGPILVAPSELIPELLVHLKSQKYTKLIECHDHSKLIQGWFESHQNLLYERPFFIYIFYGPSYQALETIFGFMDY